VKLVQSYVSSLLQWTHIQHPLSRDSIRLNQVDQHFPHRRRKIYLWSNMLYHPNAMICSSFYWEFPGMKTVIVQKVRATILGHVFNSSFLSCVKCTPRAYCPMASTLASFKSSIYVFVFYHKKRRKIKWGWKQVGGKRSILPRFSLNWLLDWRQKHKNEHWNLNKSTYAELTRILILHKIKCTNCSVLVIMFAKMTSTK
jgi:hypothetical protein